MAERGWMKMRSVFVARERGERMVFPTSDEPMNESTTTLTTDDIIEYVGETFAGRGQNYFYDDRIVAPRIHGHSMSAKCIGSKPEPYEVKVGWRDDTIRWSTCSCPVRDPCKHVAALLFTYIEKPDAFQHPDRLERRLWQMSKDELIGTLMEVAERDPEIERFLERRVLEQQDDDTIGAQEVRNLAERAFEAGFERAGGTGLGGAVPGIVEELQRLARLGDRRGHEGDHRRALAVWTPLAEVVLEHVERQGRGSRQLRECLGELESHIAGHLVAVEVGKQREAALEVLWQIYLGGVAQGNGEFGDTFRRVLADAATDEERRRFVDRTHARLADLADGDEAPAPETVIELVDVLDEFEEGPPGDEVFAVLDRLEPGPEIVEALLAMGDSDEAAARAAAIEGSYAFGRALDAFVEAGHSARAERLARERLDATARREATRAPGVQEWLVRYYEQQDRPEPALDIMCRMFEQHPTRDRFRHIHQLARRTDDAVSYITTAREILREQAPREFLRLALDEGAIDDAVERWREIGGDWTPRTWQSSDLELELARAIESSYPETAADIYAAEADMLAESGGRDSYRRAVELLERSRRLLVGADRDEQWGQIRDAFVGRHASKRVLAEMMESNGFTTER